MKKGKKVAISLYWIFSCLLLIAFIIIVENRLLACSDYAYEFYYEITGENGSLVAFEWDGSEPVDSSFSPIVFEGGKKGSYSVEFLAIPEEGYKVKEWVCNGEIVTGNKTNIFVAELLSPGKIYVSVEFEPIGEEL